MSNKRKPLRRDIYYCVYDDHDIAMHWSLCQMRSDSIAAFIKDDPVERTWQHWRSRGYKCVPVTLNKVRL